eukprot:1160403-Pelagomonas_calceolata.AAC.7
MPPLEARVREQNTPACLSGMRGLKEAVPGKAHQPAYQACAVERKRSQACLSHRGEQKAWEPAVDSDC